MTDQSRYPIFLRQGKGTGDPYAGSARPLAQHPPGAGRPPRQQPGASRQQRFRAAHRHRMESRLRNGQSAWPAASSTTRTRVTRGSMSAATPPDASRNDDNPSFPAETWENALRSAGSANAIITTPQAFSMKFDRRTPYTHQYLFNVQRELAQRSDAWKPAIWARSAVTWNLTAASAPLSRARVRSPAGRPIRTSACWCWWTTAPTATTTRWPAS